MPWRAKPPPPYGIVVIDWLQSEPLTDAAIFPSVHPSVEFTANGPGVGYTVWPRTSGNRQVKVRFLNPTSTPHTATLTITGAGYATSLGTTSLSVTPTSSQISFPAAGEAEKTLTISGLPNYVAKGDLEITFTLIGNASLSGGVGTTLYQTEASPTGLQTTVWRDVLDDGCDWALGISGENAVRGLVAVGLYFEGNFSYQPNNGPQYSYTLIPSNNQIFNLQLLLYDQSVSMFPIPGDCQDVSNYALTVLNALGVPGTCWRFYASREPPYELFTNYDTHPVAGIGSDPGNSGNYIQFEFTFHQTVIDNATGNVVDATLAHWYTPSGGSWKAPAYGWYAPDYFQKPAGGSVPYPPLGLPSSFYGLAKKYTYYSVVPYGETVLLDLLEMSLIAYGVPWD